MQLLVHYYGAGEWMDIVMIDHENPDNSDITRKGLMCPQDHILALDYGDACMLINAGRVTTQALIPVDIASTPSRGKLIFHLPTPHTFKSEDVVTKYLDKRLEDITIKELQEMYGFIASSTDNNQDYIKTDDKTVSKTGNNNFDWYALTLKKDAWTMCDAAVLFETINGEELYRTGIINEDGDKDCVGFTFKHLFETSIACNRLIPCGIDQGWLLYNPMDVVQWAITKEIPLPPRLQEWWEKQNKPIEQISTASVQTSIDKTRKKLKPLIRETNEALLLIHALLKDKGVNYLDELPAAKAWGLIVAQQFRNDSIATYPINKRGEIVFNGGDKLSKQDFIKKYQSRFERQKPTKPA